MFVRINLTVTQTDCELTDARLTAQRGCPAIQAPAQAEDSAANTELKCSCAY